MLAGASGWAVNDSVKTSHGAWKAVNVERFLLRWFTQLVAKPRYQISETVFVRQFLRDEKRCTSRFDAD
jgi:hypothetical protein